jgi:hypothetical protein
MNYCEPNEVMDNIFICPYCDEELTEKEREQICDCGCPSCRRIYDTEESEYPRWPKLSELTNIGATKYI